MTQGSLGINTLKIFMICNCSNLSLNVLLCNKLIDDKFNFGYLLIDLYTCYECHYINLNNVVEIINSRSFYFLIC